MRVAMPTTSVRIRLTNDNHVVTFDYSHDEGKSWTENGLRMASSASPAPR